MLKIIQKNSMVNYLIMFFLMLFLWAFKFIFMPEAVPQITDVQPPFSIFFESFVKFKYLSTILTFILCYVFALYLIQKKIVETAYQIPGLFFVIFTGAIINSQKISTDVISVSLIIFSILAIFKTYKIEKASVPLFDIGFLFAISLIFDIKYLFFFPLILIAVITFRNINLKEIIALLMGILTPLIIFYSIVYITCKNFIIQVKEYFTQLFIIFDSNYKLTETDLYIYIPIIVISLITILYCFTIKTKTSFSTKTQYILIISIIFSLIFFFIPITNKESITMIYAPLSLLLSEIFINLNNKIKQFMFYQILAIVMLIQIISIILLYF